MLNTGKFAGKTAMITGASRGIGKAIALKLARDGANIVVAAKTVTAHPKLPGTIYSAVEDIEKVGGHGLACVVDVRDEASVEKAVETAVNKFGGIDILVNNASAISLTGTLDTPIKRYDLMNGVNARGTYLMSQKCIPYLKQGKNPHILNISPPLLMEAHWFANHVAYTIAKYGMSLCVLGMHEEFRPNGIAVNALWPRTAIWTAAMEMLTAGEGASGCRKPEVMADAAYAVLSRNSREFTGNFVIDEEVLKQEGVRDFDKYAMDPGAPLTPDFFIPGGMPSDTSPFSQTAQRTKSRKSVSVNDEVQDILAQMRAVLNEEVVKSMQCIFQFTLKSGTGNIEVYIDLKNGSGAAGVGSTPFSDVHFEMDAFHFGKLFHGELSPKKAFMTRELRIRGTMEKAMMLDSLLRKFVKSKI